MDSKHVYQVGDKVLHGDFGEGLVVDVRARLFYDVLEVVFKEGVKRVTSIHPLLAPKPAAPPAPPRRRPRRRIEAESATLDSRLPYLFLDPESRTLLEAVDGRQGERHEDFFLHVEAEELALDRGFDKLQSLGAMRGVENYAYQEEACLRVLREMRGRSLLADEVGLGKTIEAAMVMKEYLLRGLVRRALVLVPASLTIQWREELLRKAGLDFTIVGRRGDWADHPLLICSLDTAKTARNRARLQKRAFDMVIVDEAHRLRNHQTLAWKFVASLPSKYLLLLTATPVQNDLRELYNLVNLLRPGTLGTYRSFRRRFMVRGDKRLPKNTGELSRLLRQVMIRTTRAKTNIRFPSRSVEIVPFQLSPQERRLYDAVTAFVRERFADGDRAQFLKWQFVTMVLQKEIGSSTPAAMHTLGRARRDPRYRSHRDELERLYGMSLAVNRHAKLDGLLDLLADHREKAIVFTQFRSTMEFLAARLRDGGLAVSVFHGGLSAPEKEASIERFRDADRILVSTEAGGEGRNLQFCRTVVNYDLPWNPMKIEQRIGRVHRLGQTGDIHIYNFSSENTVESHVLEILHRKINMFQLVIGEMDMILGDLADNQAFETEIFRIWAAHRNRRDMERRFRDLGDRVLVGKRRYQEIKQLDEEIFDG